ncbi:ras-related protein Rap-1b-like [Rhipicephalus sanguineus]|uniref:ras-related protein Rap-1b-like n=1 Tax=Rhipicephalus sanguineus TaxID=34632 RepID=UPI0020C418EE|nr:ras-related protein Rap-1b-like [Rhipicephalus sanguineus]
MRENKLVVIGAGGVGKTSLIVQFMEGLFDGAYKPTVEDCYRSSIQTPDGIYHTVDILDTAGSHHFPAMRELSIRSGRGFVLVFSVDSLQSFHEAAQLWHLIAKIRGERVPIVLVGNKSDLISNRQVSQDMAMKLAQESMHNCRYLETSAKYNVNVAALFVELLQQACAMERQQPQGAVSSSTPGGGAGSGRSLSMQDRPPDSPLLQPNKSTSRRLSHRLSSLGSLPSMRRKSSAASTTGGCGTGTCPSPSTPRSRKASRQVESSSSSSAANLDGAADPDQKCHIL